MPDLKIHEYPRIWLKPGALDHLDPGAQAAFARQKALYQYRPPTNCGRVYIGSTPDARGGVATYVHKDFILKSDPETEAKK